jgi:methionyl-tRNA formyltransferase
MSIDAGLDTGATYTTAKLQLSGHENRLSLYEELAEMGADLLSADLDALLDGTIAAVPQNNAEATVTKLITKADGLIDWRQPAETIERHVRAYLGWPGSRATIAGKDVTITAARVLDVQGAAGAVYRTPTKELAVYCGHGSIIIDILKPAGKSEMSGSAFLAGNRL